jgi:UDP-glucose 4-epimerase
VRAYKSMKILIIGGAGFIGSVLVKKLLSNNNEIIVIDKLSLGSLEYIDTSTVTFYELDINNIDSILEALSSHPNIDEVWHLAANSDIPAGVENLDVDLNDTFMTTVSVLKIMKIINCKKLYFASSSAVYGCHDTVLHEDLGPLLPISNYAAMKLASEAIISASLESFLDRASIFRFSNVVGTPATHGVILDFIRRLKDRPLQLDVLGNGLQQKPYIHVDDLVSAMLFVNSKSKSKLNYYNIGASDSTLVRDIAEQTVKRVAPGAIITYQDSDRGWVGDVPKTHYSVEKLIKLGWESNNSSLDAVIRAIDEIASQEGF